ncbi:MAG: EamA family transporter RarD [Candidatus Nanopelagicales bacterium]|nr:EamA family transporter RarD [Candidatus Nanopelagicales bacterium]
MSMQVEKEKRSEHSIGLINGFIAYIIWGAVILYWPYLAPAQPLEILAHRILWSLLFVAAILIYQKRIVSLRVVFKNARQMKLLAMASVLIGFNWGLFIWASMNGHVLDSSLGYYITPLLNVALGVFFFKEKLRNMQWLAIGIAAFAVLFITIAMGVLPWVALSLSTSFAMYGYVKKLANVEALESLMIETMILTPVAIGYLIWLQFNGGNTFLAYGLDHTLWMASAGIVTAIPLLAFGVAIVRLPLTTLGMLQYIGPTIQFFVGIWLTQEAMPQIRFIGFAITWVALVILTIDALRNRRNVSKSFVPDPD